MIKVESKPIYFECFCFYTNIKFNHQGRYNLENTYLQYKVQSRMSQHLEKIRKIESLITIATTTCKIHKMLK